jgi:cytoskeleton-associated protein 5
LAQINSKNNKVQINTISLLRLLLENFGIHHLDYLKPFLPEMEKLTQNTVTSLKKECYKFYAECFKWLGENIKALFVNFKPQQA